MTEKPLTIVIGLNTTRILLMTLGIVPIIAMLTQNKILIDASIIVIGTILLFMGLSFDGCDLCKNKGCE